MARHFGFGKHNRCVEVDNLDTSIAAAAVIALVVVIIAGAMLLR